MWRKFLKLVRRRTGVAAALIGTGKRKYSEPSHKGGAATRSLSYFMSAEDLGAGLMGDLGRRHGARGNDECPDIGPPDKISDAGASLR
jgi:hypothetical protein